MRAWKLEVYRALFWSLVHVFLVGVLYLAGLFFASQIGLY